MTRRYKLTYQIEHHPEPVAREDVPSGHGATDHIVVISILDVAEEDGGGISLAVNSRDGDKPSWANDKGAMDPKDLFKAWVLFGATLAQSEALDHVRRGLAAAAFAMCIERLTGPDPDSH